MKPTTSFPISIAMLLLSLSGISAHSPSAYAQETCGGQIPIDCPIDPADGMTNWRFIGVLPQAGACPVPTNQPVAWTTSKLFDGQTIPPNLDRFCVYQTMGAQAIVTDQKAARLKAWATNSGQFAAFDEDAAGMSAFGSEVLDADWTTLQAHFNDQAGKAAALPLKSGLAAVRLAFLDTAPTNSGSPERYTLGNSQHGFTLINMAARFLCSGSRLTSCTGDVTASLALAYTCFDRTKRSNCRNTAKGGFFGSLSDLAVATRKEVAAWFNTSPRPRLVLNFSGEWDPRRFGGTQSNLGDMSAPVQAVYAAIQDADCRGAIFIAAAGNVTFGPEQQVMPLLPGAWEQRAAPTLEECDALIETPPDANDFPGPGEIAYTPLVYAAGGIDSDGRPLFNSRGLAIARLAAFADHGVVQAAAPALPATPTTTLTGSSVSAAVLSTSAAATWYYFPELPAFELMQALYDGGNNLTAPADFCLTEPCAPSHRVSVCNAVLTTCAAHPGHVCPGAAVLNCPAWPGAPLTSLPSASLPEHTPIEDLSTYHVEAANPAGCPADSRIFVKPGHSLPQNPCPDAQYFGFNAEPWTGQAPDYPPCPNCSKTNRALVSLNAGSPGTIRIAIDDLVTGDLPLGDATLRCGKDYYDLPFDPPLMNGDSDAPPDGVKNNVATLENVPASCGDVSPVSVIFTINNDGNIQSVPSPVTIVQ